MSLKRYLRPWWGFFLCSMVATFWVFFDAAIGRASQGESRFICFLCMLNLIMAHCWYTAHNYEREAREAMFNANMEAMNNNNERKVPPV